jgi:signal transduction histidine kinase
MKSRFIDKFVDHLDKVNPQEVQSYVLRIVQEMGFLSKVFDALREGVIVTDRESRISYINGAACDLFGIDRDRSIGEEIRKQIPGLDWVDLTRSGRVVSRDLEIYYPENRYINFYIAPLESDSAEIDPDDTESTASSRAEDDESDRSEILGHVLLLRDITQTRQVELEKIESEKIGVLTMLAAGVAHEIGNPLNSLNIHLQLIDRKVKKADPVLAEELSELLDISRSEIQRLDFIVEKFLSAVRPSAPQTKPTDINELLEESIRFLGPELKDRSIEVTLNLDEHLPILAVDRDQMKQAFYNLIRNASQAMGNEGKLTVTSDFDDDMLSVCFSDTGPGIAADKLGKVFDPYFTTKKAGSGLGLLIVRRIVREHGGEIEFDSEAGEGTRVTIFLRRAEKQMRFLPGGVQPTSNAEVIEVEDWKEEKS